MNRNFTRAKLERELKSAEERMDGYLRQMDEADADDAGGGAVVYLEAKTAALQKRRPTLEGYRDKLEEGGHGQLSLTDQESDTHRFVKHMTESGSPRSRLRPSPENMSPSSTPNSLPRPTSPESRPASKLCATRLARLSKW